MKVSNGWLPGGVTLVLAALLGLASGISEAGDKKIKLKDPGGEERAVFILGSAKIKIKFVDEGRDFVLEGKRKGGKRKYSLDGDNPYIEVKPKEAGFKLRTPEGQLLWGVKLRDDKLEISDNEDGFQSFIVKKTRDTDRAKVSREDLDLGRVKFYAEKRVIKVKDVGGEERFRGRAAALSGAYGVLLMDDIPLPDRYIIMAELFVLGW